MIKDFFFNKFIGILTNIYDISYWICLFIAMFSIILYIIGFKKSGKFITLSLVIYVFFEGIKNAFK